MSTFIITATLFVTLLFQYAACDSPFSFLQPFTPGLVPLVLQLVIFLLAGLLGGLQFLLPFNPILPALGIPILLFLQFLQFQLPKIPNLIPGLDGIIQKILEAVFGGGGGIKSLFPHLPFSLEPPS